MSEYWETIDEFPNYKISNYGTIINSKTNKIVRPSLTSQGALKVSLINSYGRKTRSVKVLVASIFVDGQTEIFDTPIHLDLNQLNVRADNLMWRPRWFAWTYAYQVNENASEFSDRYNKGPIIETRSGEIYDNVYHACQVNGLIWWHVYVSLNSEGVNKGVVPTWQTFEYL